MNRRMFTKGIMAVASVLPFTKFGPVSIARNRKLERLSLIMPKMCEYATREQMENVGIILHDDYDDRFVSVDLPVGWNFDELTDLLRENAGLPNRNVNMLEIYTANGNHIGRSIYDASPFVSTYKIPYLIWWHRFKVDVVSSGYVLDDIGRWLYTRSDYGAMAQYAFVKDRHIDRVIWHSTQQVIPYPSQADMSGESVSLEMYEQYHRQEKAAIAECESWLDVRYPDWRNPFAYWE